jgi:pimeloyl-ACP methyl ester carboxylesterase
MSGSLGFAVQHLIELGVKLIAIDRPGLGHSTFNPSGTLSSWSEDIGELISQRHLGQPSAIGFSQGAPYALQLGVAGLVDAIAIVAGQDDFSYEPTFNLLPEHQKGMIQFLKSDEKAFFETIGSTASASWLWKMIMEMSSEADRSVYASDPFASAYERCLHDGFRQGVEGYMQDLANTWRPWPFRVEDISLPVHLWYGLDDSSPVHSPDFGEMLASRMRNARRHLVQGEGSAILWKQGSRILTELLGSTERSNDGKRLAPDYP